MSKHAFSLIELIVVVAIISLLSGLLLPNLQALRERARDSQRKSDLKQIQKALELYKQDQSPIAYPTQLPNPAASWTNATTGMVYMNKFPGDPLNLTPTPYFYSYDYAALTFRLCACLENAADSDVQGGSSCASCGGYQCASGKCYIVNSD